MDMKTKKNQHERFGLYFVLIATLSFFFMMLSYLPLATCDEIAANVGSKTANVKTAATKKIASASGNKNKQALSNEGFFGVWHYVINFGKISIMDIGGNEAEVIGSLAPFNWKSNCKIVGNTMKCDKIPGVKGSATITIFGEFSDEITYEYDYILSNGKQIKDKLNLRKIEDWEPLSAPPSMGP